MFDFLHLEERLKAQYKRGTAVRRIIKVISGMFVIGIFISYWVFAEFLPG